MTAPRLPRRPAVWFASVTVALLIAWHAPARAQQPDDDEPVTARLVASAVNDTTYRLAVTLRVAPGWYIYGPEPGETGLPTRVVWSVPVQDRVGHVDWPVPIRAGGSVAASYEYRGEVTIMAHVIRAEAPHADGTARAEVSWAACSNVCLVRRIRLETAVPSVGQTDRQDDFIPFAAGIDYIAGVGLGGTDRVAAVPDRN